jgi:formylglycine-generating enzyme
MKMFQKMLLACFFVAVGLFSAAGIVQADVFNMTGGLTSLEFVTVGNPGNPGQAASGGNLPESPPPRINGAVDYVYNIGKYEVTAGQYTEFLNAVAKTDTNGLYNPYMDLIMYLTDKGCNIIRTGSSGNYSYTVAADWANRPVNYVSRSDTARFVNWLTNGQPSGNQDSSTTETGTYNFVTGKVNRTLYAVTNEDEWYKAAYYDPNKPGGAGYWVYPTKSNSLPSNVFSSTGTNNVNYASTSLPNGSIGATYYRNTVGAFSNAISPYGTFDQGGNVSEWNESWYLDINFGPMGGISGSAFDRSYHAMNSTYRTFTNFFDEASDIGFRVVLVPEPSGITLLIVGIASIILFFRKRGRA